MFIGSDGFSEDEGFTCNNMHRAEVASAMANRANRSIILTDSSKFSTRGVARQLALPEVSMVITDAGIPESARGAILKHHVKLILVPN